MRPLPARGRARAPWFASLDTSKVRLRHCGSLSSFVVPDGGFVEYDALNESVWALIWGRLWALLFRRTQNMGSAWICEYGDEPHSTKCVQMMGACHLRSASGESAEISRIGHRATSAISSGAIPAIFGYELSCFHHEACASKLCRVKGCVYRPVRFSKRLPERSPLYSSQRPVRDATVWAPKRPSLGPGRQRLSLIAAHTWPSPHSTLESLATSREKFVCLCRLCASFVLEVEPLAFEWAKTRGLIWVVERPRTGRRSSCWRKRV